MRLRTDCFKHFQHKQEGMPHRQDMVCVLTIPKIYCKSAETHKPRKFAMTAGVQSDCARLVVPHFNAAPSAVLLRSANLVLIRGQCPPQLIS